MTDKVLLRLKPFNMKDFAHLNSFIVDARFMLQWAGNCLNFPLSKESFSQHVNKIDNEYIPGFCYGAYSVTDNQLIGYGEVRGICAKKHSARLCRIIVGPADKRGHGFGKQIMKALIKTAFDELGLHRVELEVYDFNHAAQNCYSALGFRNEGVRREAVRFDDEYWNSCVMGLLRREWNNLEKNC